MSFGVVSDKPRRPLQGYFRFRQELKNLMKGEECTSEYIVSRWNELDVQEIKRREELDRLQLLAYEAKLEKWNSGTRAVLSEESASFKHLPQLQGQKLDSDQDGEAESMKTKNPKKNKLLTKWRREQAKNRRMAVKTQKTCHQTVSQQQQTLACDQSEGVQLANDNDRMN